ncbi:amino acid adenylation domain-containing protein [Pseudomonas sp. HN11]|uniref:amino acid adenylation domain-containing protein n=1 Tax=Pseudomonas sp. HN11 TaxID=1344094 RepID=UPI001F3E7737|nr:amino acid adenylation domain-containing protein [Pseudomonas sp. HN11]UII69228.1 amino acid adenylation domain-containing protein [Pseudomonas sp. HN11]
MSPRTVLSAFNQQVAINPQRLAVVGLDQQLTYAELDRQSSIVAAQLQARNVGSGDLVLVQAERSVALIVALLSVLKTGAAYVPLDRGLPQNRKDYIARQCAASLVLCTQPDDQASLPCCEQATISELLAVPQATLFHPVEVGPRDVMYVIFTSGTTGNPKGVVIEHRSVIELLLVHNANLRINAFSRSTLMAAVGFDLSQAEIWSNLIAGACLFVVDEASALDAGTFLAFCVTHHITHAFVPTLRIYDVVNAPQPDGLKLEFIYTCGEKLHPIEVEHLPYRLVDCYGPTETTIFVTSHVVQSKRLKRPDTIGLPIGACRVYILDEHQETVPAGEAGELCIGGHCLARGYLGANELTAQRFIHSQSLGCRLYRSGDQARILSDGRIQFLGRLDGQVKIRGYRVELGEVEARLLKEPNIQSAAVVVVDEGTQAQKRLVAFVVSSGRTLHPMQLSANLRRSLEADLPDYMIPFEYHRLEVLPSNANGKTDKVALLEGLKRQKPEALTVERFTDEYQLEVAQAWVELLGYAEFSPDDSFHEVGGHSLRVAQMAHLLTSRFGLAVSVRDIYEHGVLKDLAAELRRRAEEGGAGGNQPESDFETDVYLDPGTEFTGHFDEAQLRHPKHTLLTGATGFVGIHLLKELLETSTACIHCPIRCEHPAAGLARLQQISERYQVEISHQDWARVRVYVSDLAHAHMGLDPAAYAQLCELIDLVVHSASAVNFIRHYSHMRTDNVEGLRRILRFCAMGKTKALMLMSTISIYSWGHRYTHKRRVFEGDSIDENLPAIRRDLGYVQSKWVMEKIADLAADKGLPLMTFRLGYATCHSRTGVCAEYQWWGRFIRTCLETGAVPDLHKMREGLTTVDYMTRAVAHIVRQPAALGQKFNLCQTSRTDLDLQQFCARVGRYYGRRLAVVPYKQWVALWEHDLDALLYPLLGMFKDDMHNGETILELYQHNYAWDRTNTRMFLRGSGIRESEFSGEVLARYLNRLQRKA